MTRDTDFADYFTARAVAVRRLAYALCGDWHAADDLTQLTFIKLYRTWKRVKRESVEAYTRRILINTFFSSRRVKRREISVAQPPDRPRPDGVDTSVSAELGAALATLPPRQRALVVLRYLEDVSVAEAAALMGIAEGTVKSQTARGVQTLRSALRAPTLARSTYSG